MSAPAPTSNSSRPGAGLPPQNLPAEQSVLGAMLLSPTAAGAVLEILHEEEFYRPAHQAVYAAIRDLFADGDPADAITVADELQRRDQLSRVGGAPYLHTLIAAAPTAVNATYYAQIVTEQATYRRLTELGLRITQDGYNGAAAGMDADDVVDRCQAALSELAERRITADFAPISELMPTALGTLEAIQSGVRGRGISTGFADLDEITTGFTPGQLVVVAARPGLGKSTWATDVCRHVAIRQQLGAAIFSLEMSRDELMMRILAAETRIPLQSMKIGRLSDAHWDTLVRRSRELDDIPLYLDDSPTLTPTEIVAKARRLKHRHALRVIVVDYLQLMTSGKRVDSREQEVAEFARTLKLLAKELDVTVLALSQLNRGAEQRADKRPQLSDLRESGAIEHHADIVLLIHRPDFYDRDTPRAGEADLLLAKQRGGASGVTVTIAAQLAYGRFVGLAPD